LEQNVNHQPVLEIPKLRRVIGTTDFVSGEPIVTDGCRYMSQVNDYFMLTSASLCENGERLQMAHLRHSANGSNERSPDIRLGGVIYQGHTALTDYHSTPFQVLCLLDFEYVCFERRTVSFFTQFNSGIFPWY
jgi:hypothetical protein